jgi:putative ABC transport system permease protein
MRSWSTACRSLTRRPAFSMAVILTLALGMAATTAMFSVVDAVLIKPLPFPDADRLVSVMEANPSSGGAGPAEWKATKLSLIAPGRLEEWNLANRTFERLSGSYTDSVTDTSGPEPERLSARRVAPRFFTVFALRPLLGRTFRDDEERAGGPTAAIISEGLWTRRYGRGAEVVSQRLVIGGLGYTIVGVMPATFTSAPTDVWLPAQTPPGLMRIREARFMSGVGRMKDGVTVAQAAADLARVEQGLGEQYPASDRGWSASVRDLKALGIEDYRRALSLVFAAVTLLLAIAVANIAGLMLVQLRRRARELAIQQAIGGSRAQIVGAIMREVAVVAAVGSIAGAALAFVLVRLFATTFATVPRVHELALDMRGLAFTALTSAVAAGTFGLWPALVATRGELTPALAQSGRGASAMRHRLQALLVASQIALSVVLAGSAGLMLRSYRNLTQVDLGFNAERAITFHVGATWDEDRARIGVLQEQLVAELQQLPDVVAAGITNFLPATGATLRYQIALEGFAPTEDNGKITIGTRTVSGGYLRAMGARLVAGGWCPELRHDLKAPSKAMVNRAFANRYGPDLVGRHLMFDQFGEPPGNEIVGVVGDLVEDGPGAGMAPYVYTCAIAGAWPDPEYVVRSRSDPRPVMAAVRAIVHRIDPNRAIFGVRTVDSVIAGALDEPRLNASMLMIFAAAAVALASLGLYSLLMLFVSERTREMGVRIALGATPAQVVTMVLAGAGRLLVGGVAAGLVLIGAGSRVLNAALFGVSPLDAPTLGAAVIALSGVTLIAAVLPARRAASVDPIEAMRAE